MRTFAESSKISLILLIELFCYEQISSTDVDILRVFGDQCSVMYLSYVSSNLSSEPFQTIWNHFAPNPDRDQWLLLKFVRVREETSLPNASEIGLKHTGCKTHIISDVQVMARNSSLNLDEPIAPDFALIVQTVNDKLIPSYGRSQLAEALTLVGYPGTIFLKTEMVRGQTYFLICHSCGWNKNWISIPPFLTSTPNSIRALWFKHNRNLRDSIVVTRRPLNPTRYMFHNKSSQICRMFRNGVWIKSYICTALVIAHKHNYSYVGDEYDKSRISVQSRFLFGQIPSTVNELIRYRKQTQNWVPYGPQVEPYAYSVMYRDSAQEQTAIRIEGMLKPFGVYVWALLLTTSIVITILLVVWKGRQFKAVALQCSKVWFSLLTGEMDVGQARQLTDKKGGTTFTLMLVYCLWTVSILFVLEMYKGKMFTSLSLTYSPKFPTALEDLLDSKVLVGVNDFCSGGNTLNKSYHRSCFHKFMIEIAEDSFTGGAGKKDNNMRKLRHSLTTRVRWFPDMFHTFIVNAVRDGLLLAQNGWEADDQPREPVRLPSKFAVMAELTHLRKLTRLFSSLTEWFVSREVPLPMFGYSLFTTLYGNYLYPILIRSLSQLIETGFCDRWGEYDKDEMFVLGLYHTPIRLQGASFSIQRRVTHGDLLRQYLYSIRRSKTARDVLRERLSMVGTDVYVGILYYWVAVLGMVGIEFGGELLLFWWQRKSQSGQGKDLGAGVLSSSRVILVKTASPSLMRSGF